MPAMNHPPVWYPPQFPLGDLRSTMSAEERNRIRCQTALLHLAVSRCWLDCSLL
jgi:hypothetical protein